MGYTLFMAQETLDQPIHPGIIEAVIEIDKMLATLPDRDLVSTGEVTNVLLDVRVMLVTVSSS